MSRNPTGSVIRSRGSWMAQLTVAPGLRRAFTLAVEDEGEARARAVSLAETARMMREAGVGTEFIIASIRQAALGDVSTAESVLQAAVAVRNGAHPPMPVPSGRGLTWGQLADQWTSGVLHARYPDHVGAKASSGDDASIVARLKRTIGSVPITEFTLDHADRAMAALPAGFSPATRRHYAQVISRTLAMAVFPLRLIQTSPIPPRVWLPKAGSRKAMSYLYPDEEAKLVTCPEVPAVYRLLYFVLAREGMRLSEALGMRWRHLDLERGAIRLDENKTDDPRLWKLSDEVVEALAAWKRVCSVDGEPAGSDLVFTGDAMRVRSDHAADLFRKHLRFAGIDRPELFERSASRQPIRVHDLRATFITVSLAAGRSERWIAARTGHTTSQMITRYMRQAKTFEELGFRGMQRIDIPSLLAI